MQIRDYQCNKIKNPGAVFRAYQNNRDWYEKIQGAKPFPFFLATVGCVFIINKIYRNSYKFGISFFKKDQVNWFWDNRDLKRVRSRIIKDYLKDPRSINKWLSVWKKEYQNFQRIAVKQRTMDFKKLTDKELWEDYCQIRDSYLIVNSIPYLTDSFLSTGKDWLVESLAAEMKNKIEEEKMPEAVGILTSTIKDSFSQSFEIKIMELAMAAGRAEKIKKILAELKKKYYWILTNYEYSRVLDDKYLLKEAARLKTLPDLKRQFQIKKNSSGLNAKKKKQLYKKYALRQEIKNIIRLSEIFAFWQDTRKATVFKANYFFFLFLNEVARRKRINRNIIYYSLDPEIEDLLFRNQFDQRSISRRINHSLVTLLTDEGYAVLEGKNYKKVDKKIFFARIESIKIIPGVCACPGKVTGIARIILKPSEINKLKAGEILVTNNTTPDFVPAMKKAKAIITDQGGITAHAAVVSRELGTPCVIGTRVATSTIRTGERIEVDAAKGIIRKI